MSWPTFEDGTVDWVMVFEDTETGLVPLIDRADTRTKLASCVHVVVQSLFAREADAGVREAYIATLDKMIDAGEDGDDGLITLKYEIRTLLRTIKSDRVDRARAIANGEAQKPMTDEDREKTANEAIEALNAWMESDHDD